MNATYVFMKSNFQIFFIFSKNFKLFSIASQTLCMKPHLHIYNSVSITINISHSGILNSKRNKTYQSSIVHM